MILSTLLSNNLRITPPLTFTDSGLFITNSHYRLRKPLSHDLGIEVDTDEHAAVEQGLRGAQASAQLEGEDSEYNRSHVQIAAEYAI